MLKPTDREKEIYQFIKAFKDNYDTSPSAGDVAKGFHISKTGARNCLFSLQRKGWIEFTYDQDDKMKGIKTLI